MPGLEIVEWGGGAITVFEGVGWGERLLFHAKWGILQIYHGKNKLQSM